MMPTRVIVAESWSICFVMAFTTYLVVSLMLMISNRWKHWVTLAYLHQHRVADSQCRDEEMHVEVDDVFAQEHLQQNHQQVLRLVWIPVRMLHLECYS